MKLLTIIKNLFTRKPEHQPVPETPPRLTLQEYAKAYGLSFNALRGRITRRAKKIDPEDLPTIELIETKAGVRPVKLYTVSYLQRVMPPPKPENTLVQAGTDHQRISELIRRSYCNGAHDILDYWHCPPERCDHEICKSCLRNLGNFPEGTVATIAYTDVRREGDKCSSYCGFLASAHAKHVLY